jgi:hypothetical protein
MPAIGEKLRLNLQLWDGATNRYVKAYLYDGDDVEIATVNLSHVGRGLYADSTQEMPNTPQVRVVYRVFNNASYTQVSEKHSDCLDVFELETRMFSYEELVGQLDYEDEIVGTVDDTGEELVGEVDECDTINGSPPC